MTTDPGDLVLDPTCGGGTTAVVAEQFGRRWITIDTSRVAICVARQRMLMATFPYYRLADAVRGIKLGFVYKTAPHITLESIANAAPPETETLYDQPEVEQNKVRVAGPFSVETLQNFIALSPDAACGQTSAEQERDFLEMVFDYLRTGGISDGRSDHRLRFERLEQVTDLLGIHARGYIAGVGEGQAQEEVLFTIGPRFGPISKEAVSQAFKTMRGPGHLRASRLFLLGFAFDDDAMNILNFHKDGSEQTTTFNMGQFWLTFVRMHDDLLQQGLKKPGKNQYSNSFVVIGEPDIAVVDEADGKCHIEVRGLDTFSPLQPRAQGYSANSTDAASGLSNIAYWELDAHYDGQLFCATELHFGASNLFSEVHDAIAKVKKASEEARANNAKRKKLTPQQQAQAALRVEIDEETYNRLVGFQSESFPRVKGSRVAVRVMAIDGTEASQVLEL